MQGHPGSFGPLLLAGLLAAMLWPRPTLAQDSPAAVLPPSAPEYDVRIDEVWVPMSDGVRLKGYVIRPDAEGEQFPVLLEYHPYAHTADSRYGRSAYLARRGYVDAYVQVRGTGQSEGALPEREYSRQEIDDALEIIDWLATREWSTGRVGMYGFSWSACNTYPVAALRPAPLKAVWLGVCTDDIYHEDIHYFDGVLYFDWYNFWIDVFTTQAAYPDFELTDEYFENRFNQPPWSLIYLRNQQDGEFWRSDQRLDVAPDALSLPAYALGGWVDGYRSSVLRLLEHAAGPTRAVIGPWDHDVGRDAERFGQPGPHPEWRYDKVRWWDYWLKDRDTGIMDEPRATMYMRHSHPPEPDIRGEEAFRFDIPGEWRTDNWPPEGLEERTFFFHANKTLGERQPDSGAVHQLRYVPTVGTEVGVFAIQPDQRPADAFSLVYESGPLHEELAILGRPRAMLRASATAPLAHWFVRLVDLAPDGTSTLVTVGGLNGAHRNSSTEPKPLEPGKIYELVVQLHATGWIFRPGHRIRVSIANAQWPMHWPGPHRLTTSLHLGLSEAAPASSTSPPLPASDGSRVLLPVVPTRNGMPLPEFVRIPREPDALLPGEDPRRFRGNPHGERFQTILREEIDREAGTAPQATTAHWDGVTWRVTDRRPDQASVRGDTRFAHRTPDGRDVVFEGYTEIRSDSLNFHYRHERWVAQDGEIVRRRVWTDTIPRFFQ